MMRKVLGVTALLSLMALGAGSVEAQDAGDPSRGSGAQIVVVNQSLTPVRVYVEDADGERYELGHLERGQTHAFAAPAEAVELGDFSVRVHPGYYAHHVKDPVEIKTGALHVADDEMVVLWLERELSRSTVQVRSAP